MGTTGFDGIGGSWISRPGNERNPVNNSFKTTNADYGYALAA